MGWLRYIYSRLRHPLVLFSATATALFLGTLTWLAWQTLQQDKALFNQRIQERLDSTADLIATALQDKFSDIGEHLTELASSPGSNISEILGLDRKSVV